MLRGSSSAVIVLGTVVPHQGPVTMEAAISGKWSFQRTLEGCQGLVWLHSTADPDLPEVLR